ncbi:MAG: flagellar biosynthesis protein FliQ [Sedimentisphaerales bacterium]|nr:flagellar biosynthesis protein FliQ [Sedimentisphaerales bacterium]
MTPDAAVDLARHALTVALMIALPMLCIGLVIGVLIAIIQAVTQIQEMTLTFVPKILAMGVAAIILMPYSLNKICDFAILMFSPMPIP